MNNTRRLQIKRAIQLIEQAQNILDEVLNDEQNAFDNLPESFQESSRGEQMEENIDSIQDAIEQISDTRHP